MNARLRTDAVTILLATLLSPAAQAQTVYSEDFTGVSTSNPWYFFNGACLTAGSDGAGTSPGQIPGCTGIRSSYYNENLVGGFNGVSGSTQTLPDPTGSGALRFTNGNPGGYHQNGAIVSANTFDTGAGVQITFKTVTYRGDSGGGGGDGADGISFYLMDGSQAANIGAWGGSLGYTCSNANPPYDGLIGGYLGLGIDEYGNFLNQGDNTATGYGYVPGRIGLRGAGTVAWSWLNPTYPTQFPLAWTPANRQAAVRNTCRNGFLTDYNGNAIQIAGTKVSVPDYAPIPNAFKVLSGVKIAKENAMKRGDATPIFYNLKITQDGLLSFAYSINGGAYQSVITKQSITASNGPPPASFRFGFAGSTGGSTNIHEIMCFKAAPVDQSGSSTSVNEKQAAKVETGTQAYFAFYNPNDWTGRLTANSLIDTAGVVTVDTTANWDASCGLTGVASGSSCPTTGVVGPTAAEAPASRVMLTWNGSTGIPFQWASLTNGQQSTLDAGDAVANANRLNYLRGDRSNEVNSSGVGLYRARDSVLGDIVDSSPTWVGPPSAPYTATWKDRLYPAATAPESISYLSFVAANQTRLNVVYGGANDGLLHGFRTGSFDNGGHFVNNATTPNDGLEVLAYMPAEVLKNIHNSSDSTLDYSNTQYAHNFFVDATPATGDLYYNNAWHTWLAGGLGPGGAAIYALDVTNPASSNFIESNAAALVVGEWNAATISCVNVGSCGNNLGNTYGTPQIRRFHNGKWGVVFGNGFGSATGDAGIYVMTVDPTTSAKTFYYLSTGAIGSNGIAFVASADLDGDQVTDYVYAGDLLGNVWRFDLTSNDPTNWAAPAAPLFKTPSGQPITSKLLVVATAVAGGPPRLLVEFGTGRKTPLSIASPVTYAPGGQDLYGVWDWNLTNWNMKSAAQYQALDPTATGVAAPYTLGKTNLLQQTLTIAAGGVRNGSNYPVCWQGGTACTLTSNDRFGWYLDLPGSSEQVVFDPIFFQGALIVDSTVPANNIPTSCTTNSDTGFTYVLAVGTGGRFTSAFAHRQDAQVSTVGVKTDATGSPYVVTTAEQTTNLIFQTVTGIPRSEQINLPSNAKATRLTWVELR
jgi:type IV pilus assembly protein PilY1